MPPADISFANVEFLNVFPGQWKSSVCPGFRMIWFLSSGVDQIVSLSKIQGAFSSDINVKLRVHTLLTGNEKK